MNAFNKACPLPNGNVTLVPVFLSTIAWCFSISATAECAFVRRKMSIIIPVGSSDDLFLYAEQGVGFWGWNVGRTLCLSYTIQRKGPTFDTPYRFGKAMTGVSDVVGGLGMVALYTSLCLPMPARRFRRYGCLLLMAASAEALSLVVLTSNICTSPFFAYALDEPNRANTAPSSFCEIDNGATWAAMSSIFWALAACLCMKMPGSTREGNAIEAVPYGGGDDGGGGGGGSSSDEMRGADVQVNGEDDVSCVAIARAGAGAGEASAASADVGRAMYMNVGLGYARANMDDDGSGGGGTGIGIGNNSNGGGRGNFRTLEAVGEGRGEGDDDDDDDDDEYEDYGENDRGGAYDNGEGAKGGGYSNRGGYDEHHEGQREGQDQEGRRNYRDYGAQENYNDRAREGDDAWGNYRTSDYSETAQYQEGGYAPGGNETNGHAKIS